MANANSLDKSHANEAVLEEFECPVCMEYMVPPIKSCLSGHNFCGKCDKKLVKCPICRGPKDPRRNLGMEKIFNKLVVPCMNRPHGCTVEEQGIALKNHQHACDFRILRCPLRVINNCNRKGQLKDLVDHCLERHTSNIFRTHTMPLLWPRFRHAKVLRPNQPGDSYHVVCQAYGEVFKCIWDMDMNTGFMRWCVVYMGPSSNIDRYSFEIRFLNTENPVDTEGEVPIRLRSCCHPDHELLFRKDKYLLAHVDMVRKLAGPGGLCFTITILKDGEMPPQGDDGELGLRYYVCPDRSKLFDLNDPTLAEVRSLFRRLRLNSDDEMLDV